MRSFRHFPTCGSGGSHLAAPVLLAAALAAAVPVGAEELGSAAEWVARANRALRPAPSMSASFEIESREPRSRPDRIAGTFRRQIREGTSRTLIEVHAPESARGTAILVVERADGSLERWVWLPFVRRLRRVQGVERTDHFLGTEFTYEDLGFGVPPERARGEVTRVREASRERIRLDSPPYHHYSRVTTFLDPVTHLPVRVLFYDHAGQLFREQEFGEVQEVDGLPFPTRISVRNRITGTESTLVLSDLDFHTPVPDEAFDGSEVGRRARERAEP